MRVSDCVVEVSACVPAHPTARTDGARCSSHSHPRVILVHSAQQPSCFALRIYRKRCLAVGVFGGIASCKMQGIRLRYYCEMGHLGERTSFI